MPDDLDQKRELYRQQTAARIGQPLPERPAAVAGATAPTGAGPAEVAAEEQVSRSPAAIMARLRAERAKEALADKEALVSALPGGEVAAKIQEAQKAVKRLQNIYRIINGAATLTLWGIILTFIIMNLQLILGNLFKAKLIPALSWPEKFILLTIDFLIIAILLIPIAIIVLAVGVI